MLCVFSPDIFKNLAVKGMKDQDVAEGHRGIKEELLFSFKNLSIFR